MAYTHTNSKDQTYTLYKRDVQLKNGTHQTIYFFAKGTPKSGEKLDAVPSGYEVGENPRTGLPYLKRA